jgi:hypothetical protein
MKNFKNETELIKFVDFNVFWFRNHNFENYQVLEKAANDFFKENTESCEDQKKYYEKYGLEIGECHLNEIRTERYYIEENNIEITVNYVEGYIDSAVSEEDYFHGYYIIEDK